MRARNIKPGFFKNDELAESGPCAQLLFAGLWCMADKEGKLLDRPKRIKAEIFPYYDPKPGVEKLLNDLTSKNFLQRYSVNGHKIIKIVNFLDHQSPHHTEKSSNIPDLQEGSDITVNSPLSNGGNPPDSLIQYIDSLIPDKEVSVKPPKPKKSIMTQIPEDFAVSDRVRKWAKENNYGHIDEHYEAFKLLCAANGYKAQDWDAKFMNAIRNNWGKIDLSKPETTPQKREGCPGCGRWKDKCICHDPEKLKEWKEYQAKHGGRI